MQHTRPSKRVNACPSQQNRPYPLFKFVSQYLEAKRKYLHGAVPAKVSIRVGVNWGKVVLRNLQSRVRDILLYAPERWWYVAYGGKRSKSERQHRRRVVYANSSRYAHRFGLDLFKQKLRWIISAISSAKDPAHARHLPVSRAAHTPV